MISQKSKSAIFCGQGAKGEKGYGKQHPKLGTEGHGLRAERGLKFLVMASRLHKETK